jgi:CRISPR-associated protein Cst2
MKAQGFILIDVDAAALNNAGTVSSAGIENRVETKKIIKNGQVYVYVSGQAWRYWWRNTLQKDFGWNLSPITKLEKQNVVYTEANPIEYDDDDIFGYMRASKEVEIDDKGEPIKDGKGKEKTINATVTRISPLKNSVLISVGSVRIAKNFSSMARQNDVPVLYGKDEYSAILKGMFSIDLEQVGTFSNYNKTGFKNLNDITKKLAENQKDAKTINDTYVKDKAGNPEQLIRLSNDIRKRRITDTIKALKTISGGAMQTNNLTDVTPKFIVLTITKSGNHPFSHIISSDPVNKEIPILKIEDIKSVLEEYKTEFIGNIYIGRRKGFWNEYENELASLNSYEVFNGEKTDNTIKVIYEPSITSIIDKFCEEIESKI